ncbi:hypothetical protein R5R35_011753 [Gryllus longicercus]|uniref:Uncharacterized protein n=1 Tax=Gryllus longicercus TaxID=2509291 RepID=A0AAN9YVQ5_9ORTH
MKGSPIHVRGSERRKHDTDSESGSEPRGGGGGVCPPPCEADRPARVNKRSCPRPQAPQQSTARRAQSAGRLSFPDAAAAAAALPSPSLGGVGESSAREP